MDRGIASEAAPEHAEPSATDATVVPIRPGVPILPAATGITGETWRLLHEVEAANEARLDAEMARENALEQLIEARDETARFRDERNALLRLNAKWRSYADDVEEWADAMAAYQQERLDQAETLLTRVLHEKERAEGESLAATIRAARAWLDRWPPADVLEALGRSE